MSGRTGRPTGASLHDHFTANIRVAGHENVSSLVDVYSEEVAYVVPADRDVGLEEAIAGLIAFAQRPLSKYQPHPTTILLLDNGFSVEMPNYLAIEIRDPEDYARIVAQNLAAKFV